MGVLLSEDERGLLRSYAPRSGYARTPKYPEELDDLERCAIRWRAFDDDEAREIAELLTKWIGLYPKRVTQAATFVKDDYLDYLFDLLERSHLPVIVIKGYFDDLVKSCKTLPSIAEISEDLAERITACRGQRKKVDEAKDNYRKATKEIETALEKALPDIRGFLPKFPEIHELADAWRALENPFLGIKGDAPHARRFASSVVVDLEEARMWPAILFYLVWLAYRIPEHRRETASELHYRLSDEHDEEIPTYLSVRIMEAVVDQIEAGVEVDEPGDPIDHWVTDLLYGLKPDTIDEIEMMWEMDRSMISGADPDSDRK